MKLHCASIHLLYPFDDEHLGWPYNLDIMNSATINLAVHTSLVHPISLSSDVFTGVDSWVTGRSWLFEDTYVFCRGYPTWHSPQCTKVPFSSTISPAYFNNIHSNWGRQDLIVVLIFISLMTNDTEHFFHVFNGHFYFFWDYVATFYWIAVLWELLSL